MIESEVIRVLFNFGGLGLLALFAWMLLKNALKQQEKLTKALENHLHQDGERLQEITNALREIVLTLKYQGK